MNSSVVVLAVLKSDREVDVNARSDTIAGLRSHSHSSSSET